MAVTAVKLTGKGLLGIDPHPIIQAAAKKKKSEVVYLGRNRNIVQSPALKTINYIDLKKVKRALPDKLDYYTKAKEAIAQMYGNDQAGDCVIASAMHIAGVWTANDQGAPAVGTTREALDQYHSICGAGDNGCFMDKVNDYWRTKGLVVGGKLHKIDGAISLDWKNPDLVRAGSWLFAAVKIGVNLPGAWMNSDTWDVTSSRIVGGHDIPILGYTTIGPIIASWGRLYQMTWAALKKYVDEAYVLLSSDWYNDDNLAPNGVNVTALKDDLNKLSSGVVPNIDPTPPDPVGDGSYKLKGKLVVGGANLSGAWKLSSDSSGKIAVEGTLQVGAADFTGTVTPVK